MNIITEIEPFVKRQIYYHERQAVRLRNDPEKVKLHTDYVEQFKLILVALSGTHQLGGLNAQIESLLREIEELKSRPPQSSLNFANATDPAVITSADLAGLPKELLDQLNLPEQDEQEKLILSIIADAGGTLSLDKLLIGMWRKTQVVPQKKTITTKLYRMIAKKLIYKVPGKRGLYTTEPMPDSPEEEQEEES